MRPNLFMLLSCLLVLSACQRPSIVQPVANSQPPVSKTTNKAEAGAASACYVGSCEDAEASKPPPQTPQSITGQALQSCSRAPMTGWFRDGLCRTDANDRGVHVVCAKLDERFLGYTKAQGNDLSTPRGSFPGLKAGDRWCLCASRWEEARRAGYAPKVVVGATHERAATIVAPAVLKAHALETSPVE